MPGNAAPGRGSPALDPPWHVTDDGELLIRRLEREFGLTEALLRVAEGIFEALPKHGGAIEFIPAFAEALPEGVDIRPAQVRDWWLNRTGRPLRGFGGNWYALEPRHVKTRLRIRDDFLDWLRSLS